MFTPHISKTPEPIDIKLYRGDYVGDVTRHANFGISSRKGRSCICMQLSSSSRVFFTTPVVFYCLTHLHKTHVLFRVRTKNYIFPTVFRKKTRNFLFSQCKTSMGNNSGSMAIRGGVIVILIFDLMALNMYHVLRYTLR